MNIWYLSLVSGSHRRDGVSAYLRTVSSGAYFSTVLLSNMAGHRGQVNSFQRLRSICVVIALARQSRHTPPSCWQSGRNFRGFAT